jgi:hypothetical protein
MKRVALLLGAIIAIIGSLGLVFNGTAIVQVPFDALSYRMVDPPLPPPSSLGDLSMAISSAIALVVGLMIACVATAIGCSDQSATSSKKLQIAAGVSLMVAALPLVFGIMTLSNGFHDIASSVAAPTKQRFQDLVQSAGSTMTVGFYILVLSVLLLVAAGLMLKTGPKKGSSQQLGAFVAVASILVSFAVVILLVYLRLNCSALETLLTQSNVTPKPSDIAANLQSTLSMAMLVFISLMGAGLLQLLAALFQPTGEASSSS